MSATPMTVGTVLAVLEKVGDPLNPNQKRALLNEAGRQMKELRAEMREQVQMAFKVDNQALKRAITEVAERVVKEHIGSVANAIQAAVAVEITKQLSSPGANTSITTLVKEAMQKEAAALVGRAMSERVTIMFNEAGAYKEGGTM